MTDSGSTKCHNPENPPVVKHALWFMPLIGSVYLVPPVVFLIGYFAADPFVVLIPPLALLGEPLFAAIALALVTDALLRVIVLTTVNSFQMNANRSNIIKSTVRYAFPIGLIVLQNVALVLFAPTLLYGYRAVRCALSLLLNEPSLAYWAEIPDIWGFDHTRYARYFLIVFSGFALLNTIVALLYPTGLWVVYTVLAYYAAKGLTVASVGWVRSDNSTALGRN